MTLPQTSLHGKSVPMLKVWPYHLGRSKRLGRTRRCAIHRISEEGRVGEHVPGLLSSPEGDVREKRKEKSAKEIESFYSLPHGLCVVPRYFSEDVARHWPIFCLRKD